MKTRSINSNGVKFCKNLIGDKLTKIFGQVMFL